MTTRGRLILFVSVGFGAILVAAKWLPSNAYWRDGLVLAGGWSMALGCLYQVRLYAEEKDVAYYIMVVFAGIIGLSMVSLTMFWLWTLLH